MKRWQGVAAALLAVGVLSLPGGAAPSANASKPVRALFFGDSLVYGTGATPLRPVMAADTARRLGWSFDVDAIPGTGYTKATHRAGSRYDARIARLPGSYDVVVLEGGTNDKRAEHGVLRAAALRDLALLADRIPGATIVVVGPYDPPGVHDPARAGVDDVLREVAGTVGVAYISLIREGWTTGQSRRFLSGDGLHPTTWGYGVMGARLAADLKRVVPGRPAPA